MVKLLVTTPKGYKEIIEVHETGGYNDLSAVLWDERIDGPLPAEMAEPVLAEAALREQVEQEKQAARAYLASTDWLIIREIDTGTPCPADVKTKRQQAREVI